jgi:hypothetical protein
MENYFSLNKPSLYLREKIILENSVYRVNKIIEMLISGTMANIFIFKNLYNHVFLWKQ